MDDKTKAIYAKELSDNPLLNEALGYYEQEITREWKTSKNEADRERLWNQLQAHQMFRDFLMATIASGKIAEDKALHQTWLQKVRRAI